MNKTFSCTINYIILEIKEVEYLRRVSQNSLLLFY